MTVVLDASVLVELLTLGPRGRRATDVVRHAGALHVPHLADIETMSVLRGLVTRCVLGARRVAQAISDLREFPAKRWPAHMLFERVWELRAVVTAYDATYLALAEALDASFVTADAKLVGGARGVARCDVALVE